MLVLIDVNIIVRTLKVQTWDNLVIEL